jgi:hypothetical protein
MADCTADIEKMREVRPGFRPLIIGFHWPSQPWGDEELGGSGDSFGFGAMIEQPALPIEEIIDLYADRIADTPRAREALRTIVASASRNIAPAKMPPEVVQAYKVLNEEADLGTEGEAAAPGDDREPFDPEFSYEAARAEAVSFGRFDFDNLLSPLRQLSFWKMKKRARKVGETGGFNLLQKLQQKAGAEKVRFHLMGHSFGCIVVSAILAGPDTAGDLVQPVNSVMLAQGALSLWSYCSDIPHAKGKPGYFHSVVEEGKISGPVITTHSKLDIAVGRLYPMAAGIARQVDFPAGTFPKYGGLGSFGAQGPGAQISDQKMRSVSETYRFEPGTIYNLESSEFINEGEGASGAHNDISKPEVAHAFWEAARG